MYLKYNKSFTTLVSLIISLDLFVVDLVDAFEGVHGDLAGELVFVLPPLVLDIAPLFLHLVFEFLDLFNL